MEGSIKHIDERDILIYTYITRSIVVCLKGELPRKNN